MLKVNHLKKYVLDDVSFTLEKGEIGCLLGSSGSGKTTTIRIIAQLEKPDSGDVKFQVSNPKIGVVFQDWCLFGHLSVRDNIQFGLDNLDPQEKERRVHAMVKLFKIEPILSKMPHEISGGQQQRVAFARALAPQPDLLLMDEPFSSLDADLRELLCLEIRTVLKSLNITALLITHHQQEAFMMSDKVGVIHQGCIEQWDTPFNVYHHPKTPYVATFVGEGALIQLDGEMVLVRPDDIMVDEEGALSATVTHKVFRGSHHLYTLQLPDQQIVQASLRSFYNFNIGELIQIKIINQIKSQ